MKPKLTLHTTKYLQLYGDALTGADGGCQDFTKGIHLHGVTLINDDYLVQIQKERAAALAALKQVEGFVAAVVDRGGLLTQDESFTLTTLRKTIRMLS